MSIVIPTFNESEDIETTLAACLAIEYSRKEIIVVDDSTDDTPDVVRRHASAGIQLIHRERNDGGRCGARNAGILAATGEIVVILNADVHLPPDFIQRILPHYAAGADVVLVDGKVENRDRLVSRFIGCMEEYTHRPERGNWFNWSEGFSCRREAAIRAGLFPTPPLVVTAGEDGYFSSMLERNGCIRVVDRSIVVWHIAVSRWGDFWKMSRERVTAVVSYFLNRKSFARILAETLARSVVTPLKVLSLVPGLLAGTRAARYSTRGVADIVPFMLVWSVRELGFLAGKWRSMVALARFLAARHAPRGATR